MLRYSPVFDTQDLAGKEKKKLTGNLARNSP